ncbi:unnamed protein product [Peronospora belbahrii]|uniref:Tim44-like domain-containing protein n=1 Tax=Peronospora belbahrii TaxID=622444 RepID=A0AAU9KQM1_9STRA|nr:unnamed protein product [Peronospora belbahrii]CAH0521530.1 unnamed protein product [Peronospora belbahrii]
MLRPPQYFMRRCIGHNFTGYRYFSSNSRNWFNIEPEYMSLRGLGILSRVFRGMPDLARYIRGKTRIFVPEASDEACSSMYVLSQFPMSVQVNLPEFVQGAERAAHIVLQRLYAEDVEETKEFLKQLATTESLELLLQKPSAMIHRETKGQRIVLEQLSINSAALKAVEYTREQEDENVTSEWLTLQVQYDSTEHLLIVPETNHGIEDRRAINTEFLWTFEANVTTSDELQWGIVAATSFEEKPAVFRSNDEETVLSHHKR